MAVITGGAVVDTTVLVRWVALFLVVAVSWTGSAATPVENNSLANCDEVRNFFSLQDIISLGVRAPAISSDKVCGTESCCSSEMEATFINRSRTSVNIFVKELLLRLSNILEVRAKRFDEFFKELMENSKREFHDMFKRTYGVIYLENSFLFTDFFKELEVYYATGRNSLTDVLDNFFGLLYQQMFRVLNSQYTFSDDYLQCVNEHMVELSPFGDVPHKLGVQLRRAFVGTRAFYRALVVGADVVKRAANAYPGADSECVAAITRMRYCATCQGHVPPPGSCSALCTQTLKYCLRILDVLDKPWDAYVDGVEKVADRLLGPFNIEMVVQPINIKISEAVMNFQEKGVEVSQRVFSGCGKPTPVGKQKRDTKDYETSSNSNITVSSTSSSSSSSSSSSNSSSNSTTITNRTLKFNSTNDGNNKKKRKKVMDSGGDDGNEPSLDKLIRDIKQKVKDSRRFWAHLPYQFCNNEPNIQSPSNNDSCWNGTAAGTFQSSEFNIKSVSMPYSEIQNLPFALQTIVNKLQGAFQGQDVDLADDDTEDTIPEGSGSGSGAYDDDLEIEGSGSKSIIPDISKEVPPAVTQPPEPPPTDVSERGQPSENIPKVAASATSLHQALAHLLLPIVFAWFGGMVSDLLQL